eukprot:TRINITY_DN2494_c0_g1_i3.p1 TRINITY_DN2494_c0_g1~~TRINITY_DN2494_c0_g1_i3.p1  ORF type:complete len:193 (+),score=22.61 TRINITY_DN2494_c0_g1_i3:71-649(+)
MQAFMVIHPHTAHTTHTTHRQELEINPGEIFYKIRCVLLPFRFDRSVLLSSPDFWGPLAVVLSYAFLVLWGQFHVVSWVLTVWLLGAFLIFFLARVLGSDVSYSQSLGVVGYSLIPLDLMVLYFIVHNTIVRVFGLQAIETVLVIFVKLFFTVWAAYSAASLLTNREKLVAQKQLMLAYPVLLLYIYFVSLF